MKITAAGLTDPGQVRKNNEDNYWLDDQIGLMVVADGMGGHAAGEVASQMAVDVVKEQVGNGLKTGKIPAMGERPIHLSDRAQLLATTVQMANEIIYSSAQDRVEKRGMGTTLVAVLADKKSFAVANVGDSRLYLFRAGKLSQVTRDHSLVQEQVSKGLMTAEQAEQSDLKNVLTRALGVGPEVDVDVDEHPLLPGDLLLLCTDGLCKMMEDGVIESELQKMTTPADMCVRLVKLANDRGGKDNVTVIVAQAERSGLWEQMSGMFDKKTPQNGKKG